MFGSNPGSISICGAITALAGMSFYTYLNAQNSQNPQPLKLSPKHSKSKLEKENDEAVQNRSYGDESV